VRIGIAPESITRCKRGIREITKRSGGVSLAHVIGQLNRYTRGWMNYFAIAAQEGTFKDLDGWIRRRLRCLLWKQWKTTRARVYHLRRSGTEPWLARGLCNGKGHGPWSAARHTAMQRAAPNQYLKRQGRQSLHGRYLALNLA
jgi:RNA-directed DNA polymerase